VLHLITLGSVETLKPNQEGYLHRLIDGAGGPFSENQKSEKMRKKRRKGRRRQREEKEGKGRSRRKKYYSCVLGPRLQNG
jgi:hypothetical protein